MTFQVERGIVSRMSDIKRKPELTDLVDPFLTEKTRRAVATGCGVPRLEGRMRNEFFRKLTIGEMLEHIPTYDKFCDLARQRGQLGSNALEKARIIYE